VYVVEGGAGVMVIKLAGAFVGQVTTGTMAEPAQIVPVVIQGLL